MKNVITLASVAAMLAVLATSVQAAVEVNNSFDINMAVFVPCANGGLGEVVELNGPLHELVTFTINGNHVSGKTHFQPQGISGFGLSTGAKYHAVGVTQDNFSGSLQNGQFNSSYINNFRIIGQGAGNNFLVRENYHLTINANGEVTSLHDNFSVDCK